MSISIEKISGVAFLPFPEMDGILKDELKERFSFSMENAVSYGELLYIPEYNATRRPARARRLPSSPRWLNKTTLVAEPGRVTWFRD